LLKALAPQQTNVIESKAKTPMTILAMKRPSKTPPIISIIVEIYHYKFRGDL